MFIISFLVIGCQSNQQKVEGSNSFNKDDYITIVEISNASKTDLITIPTVQCGMCDMAISEAIEKLSGLEKYAISVDNRIMEVTYNASILNLGNIEKAISDIGYQANDTKANPIVYQSLMGCCKLPEDRG